jgi:hypothetical protein
LGNPTHNSGGGSVVFNADGSTLACDNAPNTIYLWDTSFFES